MRGKGFIKSSKTSSERITPAHAGKSRMLLVFFLKKRDHPRACGEKSSGVVPPALPAGSPPRMRGKASTSRIRAFRKLDHPRACGEKAIIKNSAVVYIGSPPRMRGKAFIRSLYLRLCRITPAHAGKRCIYSIAYIARQDHPRACGEKIFAYIPVPGQLGSPPRMRGKANLLRRRVSTTGITPAHAGKRTKKRKAPTRAWDHPRACGEKLFAGGITLCFCGSPPRMRGKAAVIATLSAIPGITPAHAGKSPACPRR